MAMPELAIPREMASVTPREVAEDRTFTEEEHTAILADRVARETAAKDEEISGLRAQIETLEAEKAELQTKLDVETARAEKAEQDFEAHKAEEARKAETAARKEERVKKVREVAKHLKDDFFSDERAERWAAMETAAFDGYIADLKDASGATDRSSAEKAAENTAMGGATPEPVTGSTFYDLMEG